MVSHIVGGGLGVIALTMCTLISVWKQSLAGLLCGTVFGISMIALYTVSSIYHGLPCGMAKKVFQVLDHCTIYFLIAGTYTPMLICGLTRTSSLAAWITFGAVWSLTAIATTLTAIDLKKYKLFSMICYIGMGWCILFSIKPMYLCLGNIGFSLLLFGGILYTLGVVFFILGKLKKYFHSIFHLFVLAGSILHTLCVIFFVI